MRRSLMGVVFMIESPLVAFLTLLGIYLILVVKSSGPSIPAFYGSKEGVGAWRRVGPRHARDTFRRSGATCVWLTAWVSQMHHVPEPARKRHGPVTARA